MRSTKGNSVLGLLLLWGAAGCTPSGAVSEASYAAFFHDVNGAAIRRVETATRTYQFAVQTPEYVALRESRDGAPAGQADRYRRRLQEIAGTMYLTVQIANKQSARSIIQAGVSTPADLDAQTHYYHFEAAKDLYCLCGADTLHPLDYSFEDGYDLVNHSTLTAVFDSCPQRTVVTVFNDRPASQNLLRAQFDLQAFPRLKSPTP